MGQAAGEGRSWRKDGESQRALGQVRQERGSGQARRQQQSYQQYGKGGQGERHRSEVKGQRNVRAESSQSATREHNARTAQPDSRGCGYGRRVQPY